MATDSNSEADDKAMTRVTLSCWCNSLYFFLISYSPTRAFEGFLLNLYLSFSTLVIVFLTKAYVKQSKLCIHICMNKINLLHRLSCATIWFFMFVEVLIWLSLGTRVKDNLVFSHFSCNRTVGALFLFLFHFGFVWPKLHASYILLVYLILQSLKVNIRRVLKWVTTIIIWNRSVHLHKDELFVPQMPAILPY